MISLSKSVINYCEVLVCPKISIWPEIVKAASKHKRIWLIIEYPFPNQMSYAGSDGIIHRFHVDYWKDAVTSRNLPFYVTLLSKWWNTIIS